MAGIRDLIKSISPSWASAGLFERYLYDCGLSLDALLEKATQSAHAHMPKKAGATALPLIGLDRLIPQGLTESAANYAVRLQQAFDAWQLAGNPWSVLRQSLGLVLSFKPAALTVSSQYNATGNATISTWQKFAAGADTSKAPTFTRSTPGNWDWDSASQTDGGLGFWRWWLVMFCAAPNAWVAAAPFKFGTAGVKIGQRPDASIGLNVPTSTITALRSIVALWQREGSWCHEIIISLDATLFDPAQPSGGGINPSGYFGRWAQSSGGVKVAAQYVPSRYNSARYCTGVI